MRPRLRARSIALLALVFALGCSDTPTEPEALAPEASGPEAAAARPGGPAKRLPVAPGPMSRMKLR